MQTLGKPAVGPKIIPEFIVSGTAVDNQILGFFSCVIMLFTINEDTESSVFIFFYRYIIITAGAGEHDQLIGRDSHLLGQISLHGRQVALGERICRLIHNSGAFIGSFQRIRISSGRPGDALQSGKFFGTESGILGIIRKIPR